MTFNQVLAPPTEKDREGLLDVPQMSTNKHKLMAKTIDFFVKFATILLASQK